MQTMLLTAKLDERSGSGRIASRIGLGADAFVFDAQTDLKSLIADELRQRQLDCVLVDEAQFLTDSHVWQLAEVSDDLSIPVMCYGLRTDFQGNLFPGSARLLAIADDIREIRTICHCGRKATMVVRQDEHGRVIIDGDQVEIGGNEKYVSLCRAHWREAVKRT